MLSFRITVLLLIAVAGVLVIAPLPKGRMEIAGGAIVALALLEMTNVG